MRCVSGSERLRALQVITVIATLLTGGDYCFCSGPSDSLLILRGLRGATAFCVTSPGTIYVLEGGDDRLVRLSAAGEKTLETGGFGWGGGGFDRPSDVAALNDFEIFVADLGNDRIVRLDRTLGLTSVFETRSENVTFRFPLSVAVTEFGKLLVVDGEYGRIIELGKDDRVSTIFGGSGTGHAFLRNPVKVRSDGNARVLVKDDSGIVTFDAYGKHLRTLGSDRTGNFIGFDVLGDGLILLDTVSVRAQSATGEPRWQKKLPAAGAGEPGVPVDVRSDGAWIYVLYGDRVVRLPAGAADAQKP